MKLYKMMFFNLMMLGTLISVSSYSWLGMWMGLEINLLSIIPLMTSTKNMLSSESAMKYFITQALSSLIILFSIIMMMMLTEFISPKMNSTFMMMMNSALFTKMGTAPFHFWFPEIMEGLSWMNCMIMLIWQKIAPMILIMNNYIYSNFFIMIIVMSLIISTIMSFNQISLRKILTFSSINHMAWMIASMMSSNSLWLIYFLIYSIISAIIIMMFYYMNSFYLKQVPISLNLNKKIKISLIMNFFSLGGLPPFIGFMPKWLVINEMINKNLFFMSTMLILSTLIMLFVYIQITFSSLTMSNQQTKLTNIEPKMSILTTINFIMMMALFSCTLIFNYF